MDAATAHALLRYDPETGKLFWRVERNSRGGRTFVGKEAGGIDSRGYLRVVLGGRAYAAHRLAWLLATGEWPAADIDHANRDRADNRWQNLREASPSQNAANTADHESRLPRGVTLHRKACRFQASIKVDGRSHHLGLFDCPDEAHRAYRTASIAHFREFSPYFERIAS